MDQDRIFGPLLAMVALTFVVWIAMYVRRLAFLRAQNVDPNELTPARLAELSPPAVSNPSDNLKNLFEMPVLFYALALYLFVTEQVDGFYLVAAWVFVAFRVLHSLVHCTFNLVLLRFTLYVISSVALWTMGGRAIWRLVGG